MIIDHVNKKNKNEIIEVLIENVWIPAFATNLIIITKDGETKPVKEIRIRKLGE